MSAPEAADHTALLLVTYRMLSLLQCLPDPHEQQSVALFWRYQAVSHSNASSAVPSLGSVCHQWEALAPTCRAIIRRVMGHVGRTGQCWARRWKMSDLFPTSTFEFHRPESGEYQPFNCCETGVAVAPASIGVCEDWARWCLYQVSRETRHTVGSQQMWALRSLSSFSIQLLGWTLKKKQNKTGLFSWSHYCFVPRKILSSFSPFSSLIHCWTQNKAFRPTSYLHWLYVLNFLEGPV